MLSVDPVVSNTPSAAASGTEEHPLNILLATPDQTFYDFRDSKFLENIKLADRQILKL